MDARRAYQGPAPEQAALGVLDVAPGAGDGAGQGGAQSTLRLAVLGLEQVGGGEGGGAEAEFKLCIAHEQVDGGVTATVAGQGLGVLTALGDGGSLLVESAEGEGTTVRARIPLREPPEEAGHDA